VKEKLSDLAINLSKNILAQDDEVDFRIKSGTEMYRKGFGRIHLVDVNGNPIKNAKIILRQKSHEFKFGANAFMIDSFPTADQNERYEEVFADLFNLAVVPFYWDALEPEKGKLRFGKDSTPIYRRPPPDRVLEFCAKNGIKPKGHPLCWHNLSPEWLPRTDAGMKTALRKRLTEISSRYADKIQTWDCVYEALTRHPLVRNNGTIFLPDNYLEFVFELAGRLFPDNQLIYNDDSTWWHYQGDYTPAYMLVRSLLEHGFNVGGMGLQYHMFNNMKNDNVMGFNRPLNCRYLFKCLDQYAKLGVPLNFSEVSIISSKDLGDGDRFQELVTEKLYRLWFSHPAVEAVVWWNLVDGTAAYAPMGTEEGENRLRAGLVNFDFSPKPAYNILRRLIHDEWSTRCTLNYEEGATNCFHGFYGSYEAIIETNGGKLFEDVVLGSKDENNYTIKLPFADQPTPKKAQTKTKAKAKK